MIVPDAVGDYSDLVQREGVGVVLPFDARKEQAEAVLTEFMMRYKQDSEMLRKHCQAVARRELDIQRYTGNLEAVYRRLCK